MSMDCSGISASWCPVHGDCSCPRDVDGDVLALNDPGCPLHSETSTHGDMWREQLRVEQIADRLRHPRPRLEPFGWVKAAMGLFGGPR